MRYLACIGCLLIWGMGAARADGWVLVRPTALDGGDPAFAQALGRGIQFGLRRQFGTRQVGEMLDPAEMLTVLDCLKLNANCADRAARAVNANGTIYATVRQVGARALVQINQVGIDQRRTLGWRIDFRGQTLDAASLQRLCDALGAEVFAADALRTGLFSPRRQAIEVAGRRRTVDGMLRTSAGTYDLRVGGDRLRIDLLPGEIVVLPADAPAEVAGGTHDDLDLRFPSYAALGLGAAGLIVAGFTGVQLRDTQASYDDATTGDRLRALKDQGEGQAELTNMLLLSGSALAVTGLILLLVD
jgi:hypothetical protein